VCKLIKLLCIKLQSSRKREQFFFSISNKLYNRIFSFAMQPDVVSRYYSSCRYPAQSPDWLIPPGVVTQKSREILGSTCRPATSSRIANEWDFAARGRGLQLIIPVHPVIGYPPPSLIPRRTRRLNLHTPVLHAFWVLRAYRRDAPSLQIGLSRGLHASFSRSVNARKLRNIARSIDRRVDEVWL